MKKYIFSLLTFVLGITQMSGQTMSVGTIELPQGGQTKVAVKYETGDFTLVGYKFKFEMPEGISTVKDEDGNAIVPEVTIYFESQLFRANRTTKRNAEHFSAFNSYNYPPLAKAGVHIIYQPHLIHYSDSKAPLTLHTVFDTNVAVLKLFPGIQPSVVHAVLHTRGLKGVVLETFGAGNAPSDRWLYRELKAAVDKGIVIVNKTQCNTGSVEMGLYAVSLNLMKAGVLSGYDITTEALLTKMMLLLGEQPENARELLGKELCGEMTVD